MTEGKDDGAECNAQPCEISTLVFLMDTTGSVIIGDQNWAFGFIHKVREQLQIEGIGIRNYRLIKHNDPVKATEILNREQNFNVFNKTLMNMYKKRYPSGGDWRGQQLDAILKGLKVAHHGEVFLLFTDSPSHQLDLEQEIIRRKTEMDVQIFIFLVQDYSIYRRGAEPSFRAYQRITRGHTYITSQMELTSQIVTVVKKTLSNGQGTVSYVKRKAKDLTR